MELTELGSVLHMEKGKKPKAQVKVPTDGYLPYVDIKAFEQGVIDNYATIENSLLCEDGDLLIVCDGSRSGLTGIAVKGVVGSTLSKIYADGMTTKYLRYYIQSKYTLLNTRKKGTGTPHLNAEILKKSKLIVPSIPEQERIVARIEELFSELDKAVETLQTTKKQLAVYRQAVLKEAFDSAINDTKTCHLPINDLLTKERKGMATGPFGTMIKKHEHQSQGVPMLGIENIGKGVFVDGNKIFVTEEKAEELSSFRLAEGDIIISRSGTVGEICSVPKRMEGALLSTNLMKVSLDKKKIRSDYFIYLFQSKGVVMDQVKELCKGSTRIFLNQAILKQISFPVPTIEIQQAIVEQIESRLSVCDSIENTVDTAFAQAEAMRQSILKEAFEGRLV
ncbi:MAG: restriction endonuclease subunit S [Oscillospiraceae bacterium]|nr:restriction endonuclease subunit S [Oscillospiraceae bacterium]